MLLRAEESRDQEAVFSVYKAAFPTEAEARLVDELRGRAKPTVLLVAEAAGRVIGHIAFSPATLLGHPDLEVMGLAPMAVLPEHQGKGTGSALVRKGLESASGIGCDAVVVLGHPEYYPRFGFVPSSRYGIDSEYDVSEEAFMALELRPGTLAQKAGRISYHAAFGEL